MPVGPVLEGMGEREVDVVVDKVIERYPQVARLAVSETFVIALDSIIVPHAGGDGWTGDEARLVRTIASHMLGDEVGRDWVARVGRERAVIGEGSVAIAIYRGGRDRYLLDSAGMFDLFLPLASAGEGGGAIEALSFDLRVANQHIRIDPEGGTIDVYGEIVPRSATYGAGGVVHRRWANALFQLGWGRGGGTHGDGAGGGAMAAPPPTATADRIGGFLENARPYIGPSVRLGVKFERGADGFHHASLATPNAVDVVLPKALVAGDRALEAAVERFARLFPAHVSRTGDDILVRVGYFFFHPGSTGPTAAGSRPAAETADLKRFRIPPEK